MRGMEQVTNPRARVMIGVAELAERLAADAPELLEVRWRLGEAPVPDWIGTARGTCQVPASSISRRC